MLYKRCYGATEAREGGVGFFVCCCQESSHVLSLAKGQSMVTLYGTLCSALLLWENSESLPQEGTLNSLSQHYH